MSTANLESPQPTDPIRFPLAPGPSTPANIRPAGPDHDVDSSQHAALRQLLGAQRTTQRHEQATLRGWPMTMVRGAAA